MSQTYIKKKKIHITDTSINQSIKRNSAIMRSVLLNEELNYCFISIKIALWVMGLILLNTL